MGLPAIILKWVGKGIPFLRAFHRSCRVSFDRYFAA
jgi:hypothetical protein